jgi:hypothetical protein
MNDNIKKTIIEGKGRGMKMMKFTIIIMMILVILMTYDSDNHIYSNE